MKNTSLSVRFDSSESDAVQLEVAVADEPILFGIWDVAVRHRGNELKSIDSWTETCSYDENDCEYLELDIPLEHDYRLQRHFLLDHADQVLILADTVLWDGGNRRKTKSTAQTPSIRYESTLFYSPKLKPKPTPEATELTFGPLSGKQAKNLPPFRILPLALPEWKNAQPSGQVQGRLDIEDAKLIYRLETTGCSLFAPLCFDLNPDRLKNPYTWRHLTVAEQLEKVDDDKAVGYRIQLGKEQFLLYHSMTPIANRTILGHNLVDDLCFARFHPETGVEPLVEVQQES